MADVYLPELQVVRTDAEGGVHEKHTNRKVPACAVVLAFFDQQKQALTSFAPIWINEMWDGHWASRDYSMAACVQF